MPINITRFTATTCLVLSLFIEIGCSSQPKPTTAEATLAAGIARLQANDDEGAASILEQVTTHEPNNGRAWRNLALAYQKLKDWDRAISAHQHALDVASSVPTPLFNLGVLYAQKGDADQAFAWLTKAKATRKIDMTQVDATPELKALESDPRFRSLLPSRSDFDNPFVEPIKIVREWDGETTKDQFGWIARNIGDVDSDGVPDIVTSAPTSSKAGDKAGRIYVYSTKSGKLLWTADGHAGDELGTGLKRPVTPTGMAFPL